MANREGKCPQCGGTLSIPEELLKFSCMYCGAVLHQEDLVVAQVKKEKNPLEDMLQRLYETGDEKTEDLIDQMLELDKYSLKANEIYTRLHFNELLLNHQGALNHFSRSEYTVYFDKYKLQSRPVLEALDRYAVASEDKGEALMHELAKELFEAVDKKLETDPSLKSRNARSMKKDQYKTILAIYMVPMVQEQKLSTGGRLADILVEEWIRKNPKLKIARASYQDLVSGFKKGKLCFITTAVCESFGKPDDCYELTSFRRFRDEQMLATPEGRALVEEYYDVAPAIVTCIDLSEERKSVYADIWREWLAPCLKDIESGRMADCGKRYGQMVRSLKQKYLS